VQLKVWTGVIRRTMQPTAAKHRESKGGRNSMTVSGPVVGGGGRSSRGGGGGALRESIMKTAKPMRLASGALVPGQTGVDSSDEEDGDALIANQHEQSFSALAQAQESAKRKFLSGVLTGAEYVAITNRHTSLVQTSGSSSNSGSSSQSSSAALWDAMLPAASLGSARSSGSGKEPPPPSLFGGKKSSFSLGAWGSAPPALPPPAPLPLLPPAPLEEDEGAAFSEALATVQASARGKFQKGIITAEE
jgi:hypothetical protein